MAVNLSPVGGVAAQFFTSTGAVLTGGKLFTYAAGTTTPAATYTTSNGATAWTNPIVLDAAGRVPGSGEIWLTDGLLYKFVLKDANDVLIATYDNITGINSNAVAYTNQQEIVTATAGQTVFNLGINYQPGTNSLSVFVDGVNQYGPGAQYSYVETDSNTVTFNAGLHVGAEVKFTTTQQQGAGAVDASQVSYDPPFTGSVATNVEAKLAQIVSVVDFGADPTGVADSSSAITAAIAAMSNPGCLWFPQGTYLVNTEILIPYSGPNGSGKHIHFDNCTLAAGSDNMAIMHWSDCFGSTTGRVTFKSNSKTGVTCFKLTPELDAGNTAVANQNLNRFMAHMEFNGADEGLRLMAGVPIGGTASGCWYNVFYSIFSTSTKRAIWISDNGSTSPINSGPNSNTFYSVIVNGSTNTGVQIDAGGGQMFYSAQFENITLGTSPNATPVGIKIAASMANGGAIPDCNFYSPHWENCTLYADIANLSTKMFVNASEVSNSNGALVPLIDYYPSVITEKGSVISSVYGIVTDPNDIAGMWLFDQYGATSTIVDRSVNGNAVTLRNAALATFNASNWGPRVSGLAQGLTYGDESHLWDAPNAAEFNFGNGLTDTPFSIVCLVYPLLTASTEILCKDDLTTGNTQRSYSLNLSSSGAIQAVCFDNVAGGNIGRTTATGVVVANTLQLVTMTYDGSGASSGVKIYVDANPVDNANSQAGTYNAMSATTSKVAGYRLDASGTPERSYRGRLFFNMVVGEKLSALQVRQLSNLLLAYAGKTL